MFNTKQSFKSLILFAVSFITISAVYAQHIPDDLIKRNIRPIESALKTVMLLEPRVFEYDTERFQSLRLKKGTQYGFLADNVSNVLPGMVSSKSVSYMYGKNNYRTQTLKTIDELSLVPLLVASVQEMHVELKQLRQEIKDLQNKYGAEKDSTVGL